MLEFLHIAHCVPIPQYLKLRVEGNVGIVCNADTFRVDYLNETSLMILQLVDGKRTVADIAEHFLNEVDVRREVFEPDLVEVIRNFQWQKLITLKQKA